MSEVELNPNGCNFNQLAYFDQSLSCKPDPMHALGGILKDLLRAVQGSQRLTPALIAYMLEVNKDDVTDYRPWEASESFDQKCMLNRGVGSCNCTGLPW